MLRLALLFVLVSTAARAQTAQTSNARTALVDEIVNSRDIEVGIKGYFAPLLDGSSSAPSLEALSQTARDSLRVRLDTMDHTRLQNIAAFIQSPEFASVNAHLDRGETQRDTPAGFEAYVDRVRNPSDDRLAPEAVARAWNDSIMSLLGTGGAFATLFEQAFVADPDLITLLGGPDVVQAMQDSALLQTEEQEQFDVLKTRAMLFGADLDAVRAYIAFRTSADGQAYQLTTTEALAHAGGPFYARLMRKNFAYLDPDAALSQPMDPRAERLFRTAPCDERVLIQAQSLSPPNAGITLATAQRALADLLVARLSPAAWTEIFAFVESEPARAYHDVEDRYNALPTAAQSAWHRDSGGSLARVASARRALVARMAATQWNSDLAVDIGQRTLRRLEATEPELYRASVKNGETERFMREMRDLSQPLPDSYTDFIARFASDLSDVHLRDLVAFYESEAGRALALASSNASADIATEAGLPMIVHAFRIPVLQAQIDDGSIVFEAAPSRGEPADVFEVVDQQPQLIGGFAALQQRVLYPAEAIEAGIRGRVFVEFVVDETGRVTDPVVRRSPSPLLSEAAVAAVRASKFTPGSHEGRPVKVRFVLPINFALN